MAMTTTTADSTTPESSSERRSLRPLWLTETYPPSRGGMAQSCDRIVRALRRRGSAVDVLHFMPRPRGRPWQIETQGGGRYLACPVEDDPAHAMNRAWTTLTGDPRTAGVTHVVAFGGSRPLLAGPVYAAWLGVPLVTLIRGNDFDAAVFSARRRPLLDEALARSALVCAVSQDKVDKIRALHPIVPVRRIPNGIDLADWALAPSDVSRGRSWRAANVAPGARVIGLFGHLKAKKGGRLLLEALRRSPVADAFHVVLAGLMEPEIEAWLGEYGADLRFTVLPFLDRFELLAWFAACDWVTIPSFYDGLPNVLVEAAALGIPLIAARVAGMADVLEDGRTALLFEPGDEAACGRALERASGMPEAERAAMGNACRELVATELDVALEAERYEQAFADTLMALPPTRAHAEQDRVVARD
jgi:glycosyltransferase involved in cell wall biosynthesis